MLVGGPRFVKIFHRGSDERLRTAGLERISTRAGTKYIASIFKRVEKFSASLRTPLGGQGLKPRQDPALDVP